MTSWLKRSVVRCGSAQVPPSLQDPAGEWEEGDLLLFKHIHGMNRDFLHLE